MAFPYNNNPPMISPATTGPLSFAPSATIASTAYVSNAMSNTATIRAAGDVEIEGELRIKGVSLNETLQKIQERLAILVPDPELLAKYEALRQAYEHYKTLEALCK